MHAYLLTGDPDDGFENAIRELSEKKSLKILEFPLVKIEDARSLNDMIRLSFSDPTLIVCKNINLASVEALNAFLKNLEEPSLNVNFALTAPNINSVLATIVSRCQIINFKSEKSNAVDKTVSDFLEMNTGERFNFLDKQSLANRPANGKMSNKEWAINFIERLIFFLHSQKKFNNMDLLLKTLTGLKANGNVNLHLTNLVINFK